MTCYMVYLAYPSYLFHHSSNQVSISQYVIGGMHEVMKMQHSGVGRKACVNFVLTDEW